MDGINKLENGPGTGGPEETGTAGTTGTGQGETYAGKWKPGGRGRPPKSAGAAAQTAGSNQHGTETQENAPDPVLIGKQDRVVKPKKSSKKKPDIGALVNNLANFIQTMFALMAARLGPHWNITEAEAQAVATPAARILDRLNLTERAGAYSDYAALAIALSGIIIPRLMADALMKKPPKKEVPKLVRIDSKTTADSSTKPVIKKDAATTNGNGNFADVIGEIIGS